MDTTTRPIPTAKPDHPARPTHASPATGDTPADPKSRAGRGGALRRRVGALLAAVGATALIALSVGAVLDIAAIDPTSGGYEAPYDDYRGEPIDWDAVAYTTPAGMVSTGYVLDVHTDCETGMISVEILGLVTVDYRHLSERAIAVHDPRGACRERGFDPRF